MNSELIACLEKVLLPRKYTPDEHLAIAKTLRDSVKPNKMSVDEINVAKNPEITMTSEIFLEH